jgi:NADH pyrophosphatase NudC (nudix superfamily)
MDDYISREATVKAFCEKCRGYYDGHCIHKGECDIDVIQTAPAADVQPVKHGLWIFQNRNDEDGRRIYHCSECNFEIKVFPCNFLSWKMHEKYCPGCGARMDGDSDGQ